MFQALTLGGYLTPVVGLNCYCEGRVGATEEDSKPPGGYHHCEVVRDFAKMHDESFLNFFNTPLQEKTQKSRQLADAMEDSLFEAGVNLRKKDWRAGLRKKDW